MPDYNRKQTATQIVESVKHTLDPLAASTAMTVYAAIRRARAGTLTEPERHRVVTMVDVVLAGVNVVTPG